MSGYFRDRYQGVGAIAAAAPAPRSAPAPSFGRLARAGGPRCGDCLDLGDRCDCSVLVAGASSRARPALRARRPGRWHMAGLGRIQVDDGGGGGGGGGGRPPTTTLKSPLRQLSPAALAPPTRPGRPPVVMPARQIAPVVLTATTKPPPPADGYLPPRVNTKSQTVYGGAGSGYSPAATGTGLKPLDVLAPPENETIPDGSAMTGGLPGGAAKLWLALGLAGVGYLGYRHWKKRRRR